MVKHLTESAPTGLEKMGFRTRGGMIYATADRLTQAQALFWTSWHPRVTVDEAKTWVDQFNGTDSVVKLVREGKKKQKKTSNDRSGRF